MAEWIPISSCGKIATVPRPGWMRSSRGSNRGMARGWQCRADHTTGVGSFVLQHDRPLDWSAFGLWFTLLVHRHGDRLLRVKGILDVEGSATPVAVHAVQHLMHPPEHLRAGRPPRGPRALCSSPTG